MRQISVAQQAAITARARHPQADYIPFDVDEAQGSMFVRWARIMRMFADRPALQDGDLRLDYAEVDALTDRWARAILAVQGPGANAVGLVFSLEGDLPLAVLAVWKAGKYFVWIEPEQPVARTQLILEDAGIALILTNAGGAPFVAEVAAPTTTVVTLDSKGDIAALLAHRDDRPVALPPLTVVSADAVAYIIYTSGTTGKPKGVVENHGNLIHATIEKTACGQVCAQDRMSLMVAGGGLLYSILGAWLNGALILPFRFRSEGLVRLNAWIQTNGLTILHGGAVFRTWLLSLDGSQTFPSVRQLSVGAAPLYREHLVAMQRFLPEQCVLMNMYSASEGRTFCSLLMDRHTELPGRLAPVGYAAAGVEVQVWDDAGEALPAGEVGELVIFSPYLANGYWRLPDLTAERFGVDATGRRYYRTGDLGRIEADGLVWVLGRRDGQVKIRGFRVETAEIEVVLLGAPEVYEAAVLAQGDDDSSRSLVAFVGVGAEAAPKSGLAHDLRRYLAAQLPDYMVPAEIYVSAELPRNHLRKIDRAQLRARLAHDAKLQFRGQATSLASPVDEARLREHLRVTAAMRHPHGVYRPLTAEEIAQPLLLRWRHTLARYRAQVAVEEGARRLTYAEVESLSNRWAQAILARLGPGSEPVALLLGVELDQAVAMLAVWKCGKYVLQLDPDQPPPRSQAILADAQARLVITKQVYAAHLAQLQVSAEIGLVVEEISGEFAADDPGCEVKPDDVAYLVYTSGSTGRPKGVLDTHANLMYFLQTRFAQVKCSDQDRVGMVAFATGGIFSLGAAWLNGGCLLPYQVKGEGLARFDRWVQATRATILHGAVLRAWLTMLDGQAQYPHLRALVIGAGPLYREHVQAFQRYLPDACVILHIYSASEIRAISIYSIDKFTVLPGRILPAGYPPAGVEVQVWGDDDQPLAQGESGQIVVITPYAALGYWRQPELTAERFGVDAAGRRFYRTGDLGKRDADGCVWVLGRRDGQVKIRGFRVETAEVEAALLELPGVREVGVIALGGNDDERQLVAFVGMEAPLLDAADLAPEAGVERQLRNLLARQLPDYMIPARFVLLDVLPRNDNGKVDRPRLVEMARVLPPPPKLLDAGPRTETERQVAKMVGELLARESVGRDENFFEMGGHSLLAARLMLRIHRQWGVDLPPRHFFAQPTVAALAAAIDAAQDVDASQSDPPDGIHAVRVLDGDAGRLPFFLMAGGGGSTVELLWYRDFIHDLGEDQPVYALLAHGPLGRGAIYAGVGEMVVDAIAAVRRVQPNGPYLLGGECIGGKLAFEMARVFEQEGEEVALCVLLDTALPDVHAPTAHAPARRWWRRIRYHWTHVQRMGWRAGTAHAVEVVGRTLPPRVYRNPQAREAQAVRDSYRQLLTDYRPVERYGRRIVVILSSETQRRRPAWKMLAAEVEEHVVEGTHQTYLSVAVHETAAKVRASLRRAQGLAAVEPGL